MGKSDNESFEFSIYVEGGHNFLNDPGFFSPVTLFAKSTNDTKIANKTKKVEKYDFNEELKNEFKILGKEIGDDVNIKALAVPILFPKKNI